MVDDTNDEFLEDDSSFDDEESTLDEEDSVIDEDKDEGEIEERPVEPIPTTENISFTKPADLPLQLSIEFGRKYLSLKELSELQPGNLLALDPPLGDHVYLVINGKRIGQGEIMKIGESIGVRVTELG